MNISAASPLWLLPPDKTLDPSLLLIPPVCDCFIRATAVSAGLVAGGRFNNSSEDALGFLRLGTEDIALEFLITGFIPLKAESQRTSD